MEEVFDYKKIDEIIGQTLQSIERGKEDLFDISETARNESKRIETDLGNLKMEATIIIDGLEKSEEELSKSKQKLLHVNKNFGKYSEQELKEAYETAEKLMIQVGVLREKEQGVIQRRNDMEVRYKNAQKMAEKADKLVSQVGAAFDYLAGGLHTLGDKLEGMQYKQNTGIRVIRAQEEERQRVAREIHDGPAQLMANVVLKAEICEKLVDIDLVKAKTELNNLKKVVRDSLQDVRRIIYDLRPMSLDDLGLAPTVSRYANTFSENNNVHVEVKVNGSFDELKSIICLTAFRIVQESLNNIAKHAKASNVIIALENTDICLNISVIDDGVGFDSSNIKRDSGNIQSGFGLYGMNERVELLNGEIEINSEVGRGTQVLVKIPTNIEEGNVNG